MTNLESKFDSIIDDKESNTKDFVKKSISSFLPKNTDFKKNQVVKKASFTGFKF